MKNILLAPDSPPGVPAPDPTPAPAPAPPIAATIVTTGTKTEAEIELEATVQKQGDTIKERETRISELEDEINRLKSPQVPPRRRGLFRC